MAPTRTQKAIADPNQSQRFIETARELGCDEDPEAFERAVERVVRPQKREPAPLKQRTKRPATKRRRNG